MRFPSELGWQGEEPGKEMKPWEVSAGESVKKPKISPVASLGDDLLGEILLRLPDMASLANAALVCKSWGGVACLPAIFRRFLSLRRSPLIGFILTNRSSMHVPCHCLDYRFISAKSHNPSLISAAVDGDFLFQDPFDIDYSSYYDDREYYDAQGRLRGCDGGVLLLSRGSDALDLTIYEPLAHTTIFFSAPPVMCSTHRVRYAIIVDEADASFRVIAIEGLMWMSASSAVFSSRTHKWDMIGSLVLRNFPQCKTDGMPAGRFVCWRSNTKKSWYCSNEENILVLDTETMVWSVIKAPVLVVESYCIVDKRKFR